MQGNESLEPAVALVRAVAAPAHFAPAMGPLVSRVTAAALWPRTLELLAAHRLAALAAVRLGHVSAIPGTVRDQLAAERRDAVFHGLAAAGELTEVLRALAAAGIPALPFKGPVLALAAYGDVAARRMVDVDVVVSPSDRQRSLAVLGHAGWRWSTAGAHTRDALHRWLGHVPLARHGSTFGVELHWRFAPLALPWTLPVGGVIGQALGGLGYGA